MDVYDRLFLFSPSSHPQFAVPQPAEKLPPRENLDLAGDGARLALERDDDGVPDPVLLDQSGEAADIAFVNARPTLRFDGDVHIPENEIDLVPRGRPPETEIHFRLAVRLVGLQLHQNVVLKGLAELRAADPGTAPGQVSDSVPKYSVVRLIGAL